MTTSEDRRFVPDEDPIVTEAGETVQRGDLARLDQLLAEHPWLATASFGDAECHRTLLHAVCDFPGKFPNGAATVRRLVPAGADVDARSCFDGHTETALHWAASCDDVAVVDALLDAGADIEAAGADIGGGTALGDACEFESWGAAWRLVQRGANTRLRDAAALGMVEQVQAALAAGDGLEPDEISQALWSAAVGGQYAISVLLGERGADVNWRGRDGRTPLDCAEEAFAPKLTTWLRERGALRSRELH